MSIRETVDPLPGALIQSMRAFGYSLPSAIADLIDNSITAGARHIEAHFEWAGEESWIAIDDDGTGMDHEELLAAMRVGSRSPTEQRAVGDLGRFGLGLKTASWSQGKSLSVITARPNQSPLARRWDLQHVQDSGRWELLDELTPAGRQAGRNLQTRTSGTVICIESLDRHEGQSPADEKAADRFHLSVERVRRHLGVVFHRFLIGRDAIELRVNGTAVEPWDPLLEERSEAQTPDIVWLGDRPIHVRPFVLPHHSRLTEDEHRAAGGEGGWNAQQGFYVYRARRLLVSGGWLGLPRMQREEHVKLARIAIDLDNTMDGQWQIDVRKSTARIPGVLQARLETIANDTRRRAREVYAFRGKQEARRQGTRSAEDYIWQAERIRDGQRWRVNRRHPALLALHDLDTDKAIGRALRLAEEHLPVQALVEYALEHPLEQHQPFDGYESDVLVELRATVAHTTERSELSALEALEMVAHHEPFNAFPHLVQLLREEIS